PSTVAMPARFACSATEPPIAPRPRMPSVVGRTGGKVAATRRAVNEKGGPSKPPLANAHAGRESRPLVVALTGRPAESRYRSVGMGRSEERRVGKEGRGLMGR